MSRIVALLTVCAVCVAGFVATHSTASAGRLKKAEEVTVYRDDFGTPHIYAETEEGACYGLGYAQAEDRLEELLKQYRRCCGTMSEAFGPEFVRHDIRQRIWRHQAISEQNYSKLPAKIRSICEAYQEGVKQYMKEHPSEVPGWAPDLHPWQIVALGRYIIWGWPEGDAAGDLMRVGIRPEPISGRGSNQWVIAGSRTADGVALALIDPHLGWYGEFRFYESRMYGGELEASGVGVVGLPLTSLGHNRYCSVAKTTGGPDAADVYEEELNPSNPRQYKYDGQWRDMTVRTEIIKIKDGDKVREEKVEIEYTHHGPVAARRPGKAYTMALPYFDECHLMAETYALNTARNLADVKKALAMFQLMEQNIMVATVDGDTYYLRNGRVPIRPKGFDVSKPLPGNTAASEWQGIHPLEDLVQITNPWQGYMQNCNVAPEHMMKFCPLTPSRYTERLYLYNTRDNPLHQRAAMAREELHNNSRVTVQDAIDIALSTKVYNADLWQARLAAAWEKASAEIKSNEKTAKLFDLIVRWNRRADADSTGAIAYRYWKDELGDEIRLADRAGRTPPDSATDAQLLKALAAGAAKLHEQWGRLHVKYGEVYRVGREGTGRTWPVSGGSVPGIATPRAISFQVQKDGKTFLGRGGETSTQVVQLTKPPKSWTLLPLGNSDRPDSKHYDDQAEKLLSPGKMKPTYFLDKEELMKHVASKKVLSRPLR